MKKIILKSCAALMAFSGLMLQSCGDELKPYPWLIEEVKTEEGESEDAGFSKMEVLEAQFITAVQTMMYYKGGETTPHHYQYARANNIDNYAGYWTTTKNNFAFGPALPTLYTENNGYLMGPSSTLTFKYARAARYYSETAQTLVGDTRQLIPRPEWKALAMIAEAYVAQGYVDFYGVFPLEDTRKQKATAPINYQAGPEVYKEILADLDEAVEILNRVQPSQADLQRVEGNAVDATVSGWNWVNWVKFANSIKLRMALTIADYQDENPVYGPDNKPFTGQAIAEAAIQAPQGVFLTTDPRDFGYDLEGTGTACVWYQLGQGWNDIRLCASLENILKHFNSPLLAEWFDTNSYQIKSASGVVAPSGRYGVRAGIMMEDTSNPDKGGYGPFAYLSPRHEHMFEPLLSRAEVIFLRAEGALRGWNMGGTAEDLYKEGVEFMLNRWGHGDEFAEYYAQDELPVVNYVDYYKQDNNIEGRVSCGVKWNESDSQELKLEKIMTQKYLAIFPQSAEAWTGFRRTGYPRLFPVKYNNMTNVDTEKQIRRMAIERTPNNATEIAQITQLLGGQDCGTRVFWDVKSVNWGKDSKGRNVPVNF